MRALILASALLASAAIAGSAAGEDEPYDDSRWVLDRDPADRQRGWVSLRAQGGDGADLVVLASDPAIRILTIEVRSDERRTLQVRGLDARRVRLGELHRARRIDVQFLNQRPSPDDRIALVAERDPYDDDFDESYEERTYQGRYDD
jgi:hypothetical protein